MHFSIDTTSMTIPFLCVIVTYCVVLTGLGWYGSRQNKNLADFFTMSGKAGAILTGVAYFSTQYSMSTFMGVPGSIYHVGYAGHCLFHVDSGFACRPALNHIGSSLQDADDGRLSSRPL